MHSTPQFLDAAAEPEQLLFGDAVVLRVSRLHIGLFELLEPCAIDARVARLGINQTHIDTFGLGAEKAEIMDVRGVECADQQYAMMRGTIVQGTITWKTGRAIGGKSGKFEVTFDHVTVNGRNYKLTGLHRQEGRGNSVGALLGSMVVSGRSAVMLPGQMANAITAEPIPF